MEDRIQAEIVKYLRSHGTWCHSCPNEGAGAGGAIRTAQLITTGLFPGVGDLIVWWNTPDGVRIGYLEVKTKTGRQSDRQKHFQDMCEEHGIPYHLVRSLDDVIYYMQTMGFTEKVVTSPKNQPLKWEKSAVSGQKVAQPSQKTQVR